MIIEQTKNRENIFSNLENGDCFQWCGDFYLKTKGKNAAVNLGDGTELFFNSGERIVPVIAKIVVE